MEETCTGADGQKEEACTRPSACGQARVGKLVFSARSGKDFGGTDLAHRDDGRHG